MSNISYSLIDDDQIDDQETILNLGSLIIDLESDLEKEKIENEQAGVEPNFASSTPSNSSSSLNPKAGSSSSSTSSTGSSKHHRNSHKHSNNLSNNSTATNSSNLNEIAMSTRPSQANFPSGNHSEISSLKTNNNLPDTKQIITNNNNTSNNNNSHGNLNNKIFKSSSDERGELKMRITRESKPGKNEHKIVTSPSHKSPTSSSTFNPVLNIQNVSDNSNNDQTTRQAQSHSISSTKECGTSTSIGTITEPECLGPCEPGTSVTLEGIVWQETEGGILVVNVTWRGKTYVGALLDCTKHDWAPPRLCDSPASDIDSKAHKGVRTKRIVTRSNGIGLDEKNLQTTGKLRNGKGRRILPPNELAPCSKRQRDSDKSIDNVATQSDANNVPSISNSESTSVVANIDTYLTTNSESISTSSVSTDKAGPNSPMLIGCNEPNCSKKYRNANGLLYHQTHAHGTESDASTQDNNCSSSSKEKMKIDSDPNDISKDQVLESGDQINSPPETQPVQEDKKVSCADTHRTPSPHLSNKVTNRPELITNDEALLSQEARIKGSSVDRREPNQIENQNIDGRRTPPGTRHFVDHGLGPSNNNHPPKSTGIPKLPNPPPQLPATEEGIKPSGTSTGPPPAPHQNNCYFNSTFLSNNFNPYGLAPYFARPQMPIYDPASSSANAAFLSRLMSQVRPPPPDSPSRLLSPSMTKNLPFPPPYKPDPSVLPLPTQQLGPGPIPNMQPLPGHPPPLGSHSPHLRLPGQGEPMLPPVTQPPFPPPVVMDPNLGLPSGTPTRLGPMGGPQMPSLTEDPLSKFPRRFN